MRLIYETEHHVFPNQDKLNVYRWKHSYFEWFLSNYDPCNIQQVSAQGCSEPHYLDVIAEIESSEIRDGCFAPKNEMKLIFNINV